ncbi:MAG TPA: hypothetical protein VM122_07770 [Usitatibacter sp.]|nr:hypothetical protein [Usitatibacter sp.]
MRSTRFIAFAALVLAQLGATGLAQTSTLTRKVLDPNATADMALTQAVDSDINGSGKDSVFTLVATNNGPQIATGVTVKVTLPSNGAFIWASSGCTEASGVVTCTRDQLANGETAQFRLVLRAAAAGSLTSDARVSAAQFDPSGANDRSIRTVTITASPAAAAIIRYRLYSPVTQEHLFTTDVNEYRFLGTQTGNWKQEGESGKVLDNPGSYDGVTAQPYYRLYNTASRWHHWTTDPNEYYTLAGSAPWQAEGVDGYILPQLTAGTTALYRLLYPDGRALHHWTIDANEYRTLVATYGWIGEGGTGYVIPIAPPLPTNDKRVEDNSGAVAFSGPWTQSSALYGWSGGSAMQSSTAGARASFSFSGTSVRWIGARGRTHGIATVSVDGGPPREVSLFARPTDEVHTPVLTISDLSAGEHTLTITVAGRPDPQGEGSVVVVDAFDIQPGTTVSHWQDTNPGLQYSAGWTKSTIYEPYSGSGVANAPELPVTAQETGTAGATVTVPFRGTGISWIGYRGPDAGIATVRVDSGAASEVDLYSPVATYQPIVFTASKLADANHTLTITATARRSAASTGARVVVDAFDVVTPGRRYEEYDPSIVYVGKSWTPHNDARVWSEGATATSNEPGATATFSFTGTSVSWIGCMKGSAGGTADVFIDGVFQQRVVLNENYPIEGYQMTVFRKEGLPYGPHTLNLQVVNTNGSYVVVDAFDVR